MNNEKNNDIKTANNDVLSENHDNQISSTPPDDAHAELLRQVKELTNQVNDLKTKMDNSTNSTSTAEAADKPQNKPTETPKKKFGWLKELLFYAALLAIIVGAFFIRSNADGQPMLIGGFSAFVVQTGSMQAEIPKGSLVITRQVDPKSLQVGDDITFMANQTATITHRIIGITENFNETGQRAFETQGIMNKTPDKNPVPAANVVGKVIFHSEVVGLMAAFVGNHWPILIFVIVVIAGLFFVLKRINKDDDGGTKKQKKEKANTVIETKPDSEE